MTDTYNSREWKSTSKSARSDRITYREKTRLSYVKFTSVELFIFVSITQFVLKVLNKIYVHIYVAVSAIRSVKYVGILLSLCAFYISAHQFETATGTFSFSSFYCHETAFTETFKDLDKFLNPLYLVHVIIIYFSSGM